MCDAKHVPREERLPETRETRRLVDGREVRRYLGIKGNTTLYKLRKEGGLPAMRVGGSLRYDMDDVDRWLDSKREASDGAAARPPRAEEPAP